MPLSIHGTNGITFNDGSTQNTRPAVGFKNRIINGDMRIDQRNAGASVSVPNGTITYITDRWNVYEDTSGFISSQRSTTAPDGYSNSLLVSVVGSGSATAVQACRLQQRIEGFNFSDLAFGTSSAQSVTISFWVRSSLTGTYSVSIRNSSVARSYVATYTISSANTWERKTVTIAGDTSGTWLTDNGVGAFLDFDLGSGSNANTTAGAWIGSDKYNTSSQANWIGTASSTFYITGVQLEAGSTATEFERRPYGTELALCQRYYYKTYDISTSVPTATFVGAVSGVVTAGGYPLIGGLSYKQTMRATPTITIYNPSTNATSSVRDDSNVNGTIYFTQIGVDRFYYLANGGMTAGNQCYVQFIASSEL